MIPCRGQFVPLTNSQPTECKNIAKLLLIPQKKEGTESSFPVKMHLISGKTSAICEFFVVQMWCSNKQGGFSRRAARVS